MRCRSRMRRYYRHLELLMSDTFAWGLGHSPRPRKGLFLRAQKALFAFFLACCTRGFLRDELVDVEGRNGAAVFAFNERDAQSGKFVGFVLKFAEADGGVFLHGFWAKVAGRRLRLLRQVG